MPPDLEPRAKIFVFSQNDEAGSVVRQLYNRNKKKVNNIIIRVSKDYSNVAINLMSDIPLFVPLMDKPSAEKKLNVTFFGSEMISKEVFLAVFWCGQMQDYELNITVISRDVADFEKSIIRRCL